jgi:hypothetical protein
MKKTNIQTDNNYNKLVSKISETYVDGKQKAVVAVNQLITETYWKVGEHIVEFEQKGKERADYGSGLLERLSKDLSLIHGKGFSLSNIQRMRQFYDEYSNYATVSHNLSWKRFCIRWETMLQLE